MPATSQPAANPALPTPRPEVRAKVMDLLGNTPAFHQLPQDRQKQVLRDTALIADTLVGRSEPGTASVATARAMAGGNDQWQQDQAAVDAIGNDPFTAGAAREGAAIAGEFLKQVNFVDFVSGLIDGVFNSIVTSNIQQMEAYSKMVADVSKSLNQFRDDNTTPDDGKDQLVEQFPDVFDVGVDSFTGGEPKLMLKNDVDQDSALERVRGVLGDYAEGSIDSIDVSDPEVQETLIKAARGQIATSRQQLLATMVLMGLSRIVVTNGKIAAKIMYDFNASSQRVLSRTAQARDFARDSSGNLQLIGTTETESETSDKGSRSRDSSYESGKSSYSGTYDADYYTKGKYKYTQRPVMTAQSMATEQQSDNFSARASLAGQVEVNFKSDYLPLDKMATPEMMAAIQMRSKPIDHNKPQYTPGPAPAAAAPAPAPAPPPAAPAAPRPGA